MAEPIRIRRESETPGDKVKRLRHEQVIIARETVKDLISTLENVQSLAEQIISMGDAAPIGVREICRNLQASEGGRAVNLQSLINR